MVSSYILYMLVSECGRRSYVGITKQLDKRLKRHNGQLAGGARATRGRNWHLGFVVCGIETDRVARQLEYYMHHTRQPNGTPIARRARQFCALLARPDIIHDTNLCIQWHAEQDLATQLEWPDDVRHVTMSSSNDYLKPAPVASPL